MKKKFIKIIIGIFFIYFMLSLRSSKSLNEQNDNIAVYIENQLKNHKVEYISVKNMTSFKWDELFIIRPYASVESISNVIGANYDSEFSGLYDEVTKKMIFLRNKEIVYEENYYSNIFDFDKYYYRCNEELVINSSEYSRELQIY